MGLRRRVREGQRFGGWWAQRAGRLPRVRGARDEAVRSALLRRGRARVRHTQAASDKSRRGKGISLEDREGYPSKSSGGSGPCQKSVKWAPSKPRRPRGPRQNTRHSARVPPRQASVDLREGAMARQLPASKKILRGGFQPLTQLTTDSSNLSVARRPSLQQAVRQKTFCVNFSFFSRIGRMTPDKPKKIVYI